VSEGSAAIRILPEDNWGRGWPPVAKKKEVRIHLGVASTAAGASATSSSSIPAMATADLCEREVEELGDKVEHLFLLNHRNLRQQSTFASLQEATQSRLKLQ